jgi:hypothetical protein
MAQPDTPQERPQPPKQPELSACDRIIAFRMIDSKSWRFNSGNLCLGLKWAFSFEATENNKLASDGQ